MNKKILMYMIVLSLPTITMAGKRDREEAVSRIAATPWGFIGGFVVGGSLVAYQVYKRLYGQDASIEEIRTKQKSMALTTKQLLEQTEILGIDQKKMAEKIDAINGSVKLVRSDVQTAQKTLDVHGTQLTKLDTRTTEMNNHLLAIRAKQEEHSKEFGALHEKLTALQTTNASKTDLATCSAKIQNLIEERNRAIEASINQLKQASPEIAAKLRSELQETMQAERRTLEANLAKLVVTQDFVQQCCTRLEDNLAIRVKASVREEFDAQRKMMGIEPAAKSQPSKQLLAIATH